MVIIEMNRNKVRFNKPIYADFFILKLSKVFVCFYYDYVKRTFGDQAKLMYTDTDSLLYNFTVPDIYDYNKRDLSKFDTSDYPVNNLYVIPLVNKKVLGLMKDECNGKIITEFVGLRAKLYTFKILGEKKKRAKGIKEAALETITFDDYKNCLLRYQNLKKCQSLIQSKKHEVYTVSHEKLALSWCNDKRILSSDTTDTLPYRYNK